MPEWKRLPGDAVNWEWTSTGYCLRLGKDINGCTIAAWHYRDYQSQAEATADILAHAKRLRRIAEEIEAALASAPKEVTDAKA